MLGRWVALVASSHVHNELGVCANAVARGPQRTCELGDVGPAARCRDRSGFRVIALVFMYNVVVLSP